MDAELGDEETMRAYVEERSGKSFCDVVWGSKCSDMELKYISKWIGPGVNRDKNAMTAEKTKWEQELMQGTAGKFAQNKQRVCILGKILKVIDYPEL